LESWIVHSFERTIERREKARTLAQQALRLQPDLPEAHLAMGFSLYYGGVPAFFLPVRVRTRGIIKFCSVADLAWRRAAPPV